MGLEEEDSRINLSPAAEVVSNNGTAASSVCFDLLTFRKTSSSRVTLQLAVAGVKHHRQRQRRPPDYCTACTSQNKTLLEAASQKSPPKKLRRGELVFSTYRNSRCPTRQKRNSLDL
jgi:hypothetical protein